MISDAAAAVRADVSEARALGVTGTPTFLIGEVTADGLVRVSAVLSGARRLSAFSDVIDPLLGRRRRSSLLSSLAVAGGALAVIVILVVRRRRESAAIRAV